MCAGLVTDLVIKMPEKAVRNSHNLASPVMPFFPKITRRGEFTLRLVSKLVERRWREGLTRTFSDTCMRLGTEIL